MTTPVPVYFDGEDEVFYQTQLNQWLIENVGGNGWQTPNLTTTEITGIAPSKPNGTIWYDSTTNQAKMMIGGIVKVFAS